MWLLENFILHTGLVFYFYYTVLLWNMNLITADVVENRAWQATGTQ